MTQSITRETFVQATRDLPELRISEVVGLGLERC